MTPPTLAQRRLAAQHLARPTLARPADVVRWMGAVQSQDLPAGLWAVGVRTRGATVRDVERALADARIARSWPMRGTLHFTPPDDLRWMLDLLAPRALRKAASRERALGITAATLARSRAVLQDALRGGRTLTRPAAYALLAERGVPTTGQRGIHILGHLAHEGLLVLGPREGKQPTFVLLDEWVPPRGRPPTREAALGELARRYFTSHGPATLADFAWWTGLPKSEAREAVDCAGPALAEEDDGAWRAARPRRAAEPSPTAHLLPAFDELLVAYKDRSAALARFPPGRALGPAQLLSPTVVVDGQVVGTWTRAATANGVTVRVRPQVRLTADERRAVARAGERYGAFLETDVRVVFGRGR